MVTIFGTSLSFNHMIKLSFPPYFFGNMDPTDLEDGQGEAIYKVEKYVTNSTIYTDVPLMDRDQKYHRKMILLDDFHEEVVHEGKQDAIKAEKKRRKKARKN